MYAAVWGIATLARREAREVLLPFGPKQAPEQRLLLAMLALLGN
jgi:hypothetical protein